MWNKINPKEENEHRLSLDIQLLNSLKPIPGKIIQLNEISDKINIESPIKKNNTLITINNNIPFNNNLTNNNYSDFNFNIKKQSFEQYLLNENSLFNSQSNQSFLNLKRDRNMNNWTDLIFPQSDTKINNDKFITRNKFSPLGYHYYDNEKLFKKKDTLNLVIDNNFEEENNFIINNNNHNETKNNKITLDDKNKLLNEKDDDIANKKVIFNIENISHDDNTDKRINNSEINLMNKNIFKCSRQEEKKYNKTKRYKCNHHKCDFSSQTLRQLQNHHYKMIPECQLDSILLLKLIHKTKISLLNLLKNNTKKKEYFSNLYESNINKFSLNNYTEFIAGMHFN